MLELIKVKKIYTTKAGLTYALNGVSLNFEEKGLVFITGQSGSGKTTMLNVIGGLDGIDDGEIVVNGRTLSSLTDKEYDAYRNTFIGFVFQEYNLLQDYTVEKNICIANELQGKKTDKKYFNYLLDLVGIKGLEKRKPSQLSGGQKQRVAIARALIKNPSIIMADEPTGALDSETGIQVLNVLKKLSKEKLVIVVSHDIELAEKYADRIIRIKDGKVESDTMLETKTLQGNLYENNETLTIKAKVKLDDEELQTVKNAVLKGKAIDVKDTVEIREKSPSPKIVVKRPKNPAKFINSKMKLKSSAELGAKSLGVKPLRLFFTILLSAIAFAVFGVFDTIAAYSKSAIASNIIATGDYSAISLSATHYQQNTNKSIKINLNDEYMEDLNAKSGYNFRPVYSFNKQNQETLVSNTTVGGPDFTTKKIVTGTYFYLDKVNGFVEFDAKSEVSVESGNTILDKNGYNYKIVAGEYPSKINLNSQAIGVSTYLIDSLWHFYYGKDIVNYNSNDVMGTKITLNGVDYTIQCIIDCGEIPLKYQALKYQTKNTLDGLLEADFQTFINSGLYLNCFLPKGYFEELKEQNNKVQYYFCDSKYIINEFSVKSPSNKYDAYANTVANGKFKFIIDSQVKQNNVYYFKESDGIKEGSNLDDAVTLKDDEILISFCKYYDIYNSIYLHESGKTALLNQLAEAVQKENNYNEFRRIFNEITQGKEPYIIKNLGIRKVLSSDDELVSGEFKIVGVYFDINKEEFKSKYQDTSSLKTNTEFEPIIVNESALDLYGVYKGQGEYSRIVAPLSSNGNSKVVASQLDNKDGLIVSWFENSVLKTLSENEDIIKQASQLFLYVAIILALFSIFMLFNYISVSIVSKRQAIGVLRALGCNGKDVFRMFISESLIIAFINSVLAVIIAIIGCMFVNGYVKNVMMISANFALYSYRQVIFTVILCFVTSIISSIIPITKICKEKPVKLIREP